MCETKLCHTGREREEIQVEVESVATHLNLKPEPCLAQPNRKIPEEFS